MTKMLFFEKPTWSVSDITCYLRDILDSDELLQDVWVYGEISNLARPSSGHLYFTLKDKNSALKCVMWRSSVFRTSFALREGQAVEVHGKISIYEANGIYQLYVDQIRAAGEGALYQEFLLRKARLEAAGLFDPERKKNIPRFPNKIGIVTSPSGAALRDILNTIRRRYPVVEIFLAPSSVQGETASAELIASLSKLNTTIQPDVIIIARGGGSIEDLWAFNDENLAYAISASKAPVISGIGHETDFTIADFVADLRAPTPTAAAELATSDRLELLSHLDDLVNQMNRLILHVTSSMEWQIERSLSRLFLRSPVSFIQSNRQKLDDLSRQMNRNLIHMLQVHRTNLEGMVMRLSSLQPHSILKRGYALITSTDGRLVRTIFQVQIGNLFNVRLHDGKFPVIVHETPSQEFGNERENNQNI